MSTYARTKIPSHDSKWCVLDAFCIKQKSISPQFVRKMFDKGYRYIYISYGNMYAYSQEKYQNTLSNSDYDIFNEGKFCFKSMAIAFNKCVFPIPTFPWI